MALNRCRACGAEFSAEAQNCPKCGAQGPDRRPGLSPFSSPPTRQKAGVPNSQSATSASQSVAPGGTPLPWSLLIGPPLVLIGILATLTGALSGFAVLMVLSALVFVLMVIRQARRPEMYCLHCGMAGMPRIAPRGFWLMQIVLLFFFIIPGLIYWAWRMGPRSEVCSHCGQHGLIPATSPKAQGARRPQ